MKQFFLPVLCALALTACGTKNVPSKAPTNPNPPGKDPNGQKVSCPAASPATMEVITLLFAKPVPPKVAVRMAGETAFRYNECASGIAMPGIIVRAARPNAGALVITVDLNHTTDSGGFTLLPSTQQLDVLDCGSNAVVSAGKTAMELNWNTSYPNGNTCAEQVQGIYNGQATPPASFEDEQQMEPQRGADSESGTYGGVLVSPNP